jgi:DNA-binding HxlR family transcriptional regulator
MSLFSKSKHTPSFVMGKKIKRRSNCAISFALDILGDKWSLLIIRDLLFFSAKRTYGDFLASEERIATNILADRLLLLEEYGIISKTDSGKKSRYCYSLTDKGIELLPLLLEFTQWSSRHDDKSGTPKKFLSRLKKDRKGLMKEILLHVKNNLSVMDKYLE